MKYPLNSIKYLFLGCFLASCASTQAAPANSGSDWVELGSHRYVVEIADDNAKRAQGLMFRESLDKGRGMLFIHDRQEPQAYWMKNTKIALDILYFDNDLKLVSQQVDVPPCTAIFMCPSYPSEAPARFVLELNAGEAKRIKLKNGDNLKLSPSLQHYQVK